MSDKIGEPEPSHDSRAADGRLHQLCSGIWREMKDAPKETRLLGWHPTRGLGFYCWTLNGRTKTEFWNDPVEMDCYEYECDPPTHWLEVLHWPNVDLSQPHPSKP